MNVLFIFLGIIIGLVISIVVRPAIQQGTVEIDMADPDIPYLRLQMTDTQLDKLHKKKYVIFKVDPTADFTRQKQVL